MFYKATDFYNPEYERTIRWDDPHLNIDWCLDHHAVISRKGSFGRAFGDAEKFD